eukprot:3894831-Rhodomonas_salina.1
MTAAPRGERGATACLVPRTTLNHLRFPRVSTSRVAWCHVWSFGFRVSGFEVRVESGEGRGKGSRTRAPR